MTIVLIDHRQHLITSTFNPTATDQFIWYTPCAFCIVLIVYKYIYTHRHTHTANPCDDKKIDGF